MTYELRAIIADLAAGRCVPSMQKRAAEMLRVADVAVNVLRLLHERDATGPFSEEVSTALAAADLFFYTDAEPTPADELRACGLI